MIIEDFHTIGNKLLSLRTKAGLTQWEVAELAFVSDRTYADIERGKVNMRIETFLNICKALKTTPNEVLTETTDQDKSEKPLQYIRNDIGQAFLAEDSSEYSSIRSVNDLGSIKTSYDFELFDALSVCTPHERKTAIQLLYVYLQSLREETIKDMKETEH